MCIMFGKRTLHHAPLHACKVYSKSVKVKTQLKSISVKNYLLDISRYTNIQHQYGRGAKV